MTSPLGAEKIVGTDFPICAIGQVGKPVPTIALRPKAALGGSGGWFRAATVCLLGCTLLTAWGSAETALRVESSYCRRLHQELDPGSIIVFLKNQSAEKELTVAAVKLDDIALPVCNVALPASEQSTDRKAEQPQKDGAPDTGEPGEAATHPEVPHDHPPAPEKLPAVLDFKAEDYSGRRIIWAGLTPNPIPPGGLAELRIQMAHRQTRASKLTFVDADGGIVETKVAPWPPPLRIVSVGFPGSLDGLYLYLENLGKQDETIEEVTLNGKSVGADDLWIPDPRVRPNETVPVRIRTQTKLAWGERVYLGVRAAKGPLVMESARVMTGCVLGMEHGGPVWDATSGERKTDSVLRPASALSNLSSLGARPIVELFACPMHALRGHRRKCGEHILRKSLEVFAEAPKALSCVHLCRVRLDEAAFLFGPAADVVKINPYFWPEKFHDSPREHSSQRYVRLAVLGASPRPVVTCLMAGSVDGKRPTPPGEVWLMFCYQLSRGAKGFLYRTRPDRIEAERRREMLKTCGEINDAVRLLRSFIEISCDWYRGESADDKVEVTGLLSGDKGLVIVLLNRQITIPGHKPGPFECEPIQPFTTRVGVPRWARVRSLVPIERGQRGESVPFALEKGSISFQAGPLETGRILLAEFEQAGQ